MAATDHHNPLDLVVDRLTAAGCNPRRAGQQWTAKCPVLDNHKQGDRNPSLSVGEGPDGKALIHCHAGCTLPEVARALGLGLTDLFPKRPPSVTNIDGGGRIKATYDYYDTDGTLIFQVVRYDPKSFRQRQPDPSGNGWVWNLKGVDRRPLYHAPQVAAAIAAGRTVWVCEGEKDAEAVQWAVDGATTTNSGGAGNWRPENTEALADAADVTIIHDNDAPGVAHARTVAGALAMHRFPITVIRPPDGFKDAAEALGAGHSLDAFPPVWKHTDGDAWLRGAEPTEPNEQTEAADAEKRNDLLAQLIDWPEFWARDHTTEEWVAWPLIPAGRQVALFAPAKTGKSIVTLAAAAAVASGRSVLGAPPQPARSVLYLDYEMTDADLHERLEALGYGPEVDLSLLHYALLPSLPPLNTPEGCKALRALATLVDAEAVVIDTMGRAVIGEENSADSYREFARLTGIALKADGRAVLRTDHAGKEKERGQRGSSAKNDDVDVVLRLDPCEGGWMLSRTHSRVAWVPDKTFITKTEDDLDGTVRIAAQRQKRTFAPGTKELVARLKGLGVVASTGRPAAARLAREAGEKVSNRRLADALAWMKDELPTFVEGRRSNGDSLGDRPPGESGGHTRGQTGTDCETPAQTPGTGPRTDGDRTPSPSGDTSPPRSGGQCPPVVPERRADEYEW